MKKRFLGLLTATVLLCCCCALSASASEIGATYSGLAMVPNEAGDMLVGGKAIWALLEDGTRVLALVDAKYVMSVEGVDDLYACEEKVPAPTGLVMKAVEDTNATSVSGIPMFFYAEDTINLMNAMIPGTLTVASAGEAAFSKTLAFGDAITIVAEGESYRAVFE